MVGEDLGWGSLKCVAQRDLLGGGDALCVWVCSCVGYSRGGWRRRDEAEGAEAHRRMNWHREGEPCP